MVSQIARDAPRLLNIEFYGFCSLHVDDVGCVQLVLEFVEGAGRVDKQSARFEAGPNVLYDAALQRTAVVYIVNAPFAYCPVVFAEHAFSRTGHISEDDIKENASLLEILGVVVGYHDVGVSELLHILCENLCSCAHGFIADEQTAVGKDITHGCRLSARCSTKVEHDNRLVNELSYHKVDKHGRGFLGIIQTGMEEWVEGEVGPFCKVSAIVGTPGHNRGCRSFAFFSSFGSRFFRLMMCLHFGFSICAAIVGKMRSLWCFEPIESDTCWRL